MGLYFHVYAGPALVCKYHQQEVAKQTTKTENRCKNNSSHRDKTGKANFCEVCGGVMSLTQITRESKTTKKSVDSQYDIMLEGGFREDTFDRCWGGLNNEDLIEGHDVLVPSGASYLGRQTRFPTKEFDVAIRNPDQKAEIAKMEETFSKEIAFLRTKYDSVTLEWLVLVDGR